MPYAKLRLPGGQVVDVSFSDHMTVRQVIDGQRLDNRDAEDVIVAHAAEGVPGLNKAADELNAAVAAQLPPPGPWVWHDGYEALADWLAAEQLAARIEGAEVITPRPPTLDWENLDMSIPEGAVG